MNTYVGIDVAKRECVVAVEGRPKLWTVGNDARGMQRLLRKLKEIEAPFVVLEATGGYERRVVRTLVARALPVAVSNPRPVRDFAKACGKLAKTDAIDAKVLVDFGRKMNPEPNAEALLAHEPLRALAARRSQLIALRTEEKNRLEHAEGEAAKSVRRMLQPIEREIARMDQQIQRMIEDSEELKQRHQCLCTVPGIAETSAAQLLACLPELGHATRRELAALAGLAPRNRDSGTVRGKRCTGGARREARRALYMPALVAAQHNPILKNYYQRLLQKGKPKKLALTAVMRKLLTIINAMLKKNQPWKLQPA